MNKQKVKEIEKCYQKRNVGDIIQEMKKGKRQDTGSKTQKGGEH